MTEPKGLGYLPDLKDHRDIPYLSTRPASSSILELPPYHSLLSYCPPVYDQGSLGCHDAQTEVLTNEGWVKWPEYTPDKLLATINPVTQFLEYQAPTKLFRARYDGEMYKSSNKSIDFCVTPNHRMYQRKWDQARKTLRKDFSFVPIKDCGWYFGLPLASKGFVGAKINSLSIGNKVYKGEDFITLIALIISDGWVGGTTSNKNAISFCCFREDRKERVKALAARLGLHELPGRANVWKWSDNALANWIKSNCYTSSTLKSNFKKIPDFIKVVSKEQLNIFFSFFGDEHTNSKGQQAFYSSSSRLIDDLQELLLKIGKRSSIYERPPRTARMKDGRIIHAENCTRDITLTVRNVDKLSIDRKKQIFKEHYKGEVFCASVPNATLITRRNGSILISGNSCTAQAIAAAYEMCFTSQLKMSLSNPFSRLFIYYNEREMEGTVDLDAGAHIRDGVKSVASIGVCTEDLWEYDITKFREKPLDKAYEDAQLNQAIVYARVSSRLSEIKLAIFDGFPVIFGFTVYESFYSSRVEQTGTIGLPKSNERVVGGHAVLAVGYDDERQCLLCRNSWGSDWANDGYFYMPYAYLNLASDFWVIKKVE